MRIVVVVICLAGAACGPTANASDIAMATPQALSCASAPPLGARMWISGLGQPCDLVVDAAANTTSGSCEAAPGRTRTLTIDWFTPSDQGIDLLLAQARGTVELKADVAETAFTVADGDVKVRECLDMSGDQLNGSPTIRLNNADVPVCDVDNSCGAGDDDTCTNLGEICAGTDPFQLASGT